jgi:hypothetical protein
LGGNAHKDKDESSQAQQKVHVCRPFSWIASPNHTVPALRGSFQKSLSKA